MAKIAVESCTDSATRQHTALKQLATPPIRPMSRRLLPHDATLHPPFQARLNDIKVLYVKGLRRMAFSGLRFLFLELGFQPREILHFSFLGNGITSIMCQNSSVADRVRNCFVNESHISFLELFDPSLPLPRHDGSILSDDSAISHSLESFISRVVREISFSSDLLVCTFLQRQVSSCSLEITSRVRSLNRGSRDSRATSL